jgi:hypothetical protein
MFAVVAVLIGLVIGLATGGRLSHLARRSFGAVWLLALGVILQAVTEVFHLPKNADYIAVLVSYGALAAFAIRNLGLTGMGVVAVGLALNIVPIAVNRGMPVRATAIVDAHVARADQIATLGFGGKRHLEGRGDHLTDLGDILPDWVFHEVLSFGDLVMAVGIAAVFANLLRPTRRRVVPRAPARATNSPVPDPPTPPVGFVLPTP